MEGLETVLSSIRQTLMEGQAEPLRKQVEAALQKGVGAEDILNQGLIAGMGLLGQRFEKKEAFVPELLLAARAMTAVMPLLESRLVKGAAQSLKSKVVIGTVQGDIHNIGKNLVIVMLKGSGFEVTDLGIDVPPQGFVDAARQGASLVCMSALLVTSLPAMKTTVEALRSAGLGVKTMVGGAVVTPTYARTIGADGYAANAAAAANRAKELLSLK